MEIKYLAIIELQLHVPGMMRLMLFLVHVPPHHPPIVLDSGVPNSSTTYTGHPPSGSQASSITSTHTKQSTTSSQKHSMDAEGKYLVYI